MLRSAAASSWQLPGREVLMEKQREEDNPEWGSRILRTGLAASARPKMPKGSLI
jgi:hypothetical protein